MANNQKVALIIMDGWGKEKDKSRSAIAQAKTPNVDSYYKQYAQCELTTHGASVGLPNDQMGNSEVGHMNIGAGRIVFQELMRINNTIEDGSLKENGVLKNIFAYAKNNRKPLHLIGLVSNGGVHSHINHLKALCNYAQEADIKDIFIHVFTDGRDCDPKSGIHFIEELELAIEGTNAKIASIIGRYYAMDRDKRWERIQKAYNLLVHGHGAAFTSANQVLVHSYENNVTDEFVEPAIILNQNKKPIATIQNEDAVICFNFRTDRCREITMALTQSDFPNFKMEKLLLHFVTMTRYDNTFKGVNVIFDKDDLKNTLGEILAQNGKTQLRIAETEKYPHVTFFFSGGREKSFEGENRIMVNSPKVATYDLLPEMSAFEVKDKVIEEIKKAKPDFICLNFANTDMVGHTGVFTAAIIAAQTVDHCVAEVVNEALKNDYTILLTADHGNADMMVNPDGSPNTAHTKNLVPLFLISKEKKWKLKNGKLGDLAVTILNLMELDIPKEMTGEFLCYE